MRIMALRCIGGKMGTTHCPRSSLGPKGVILAASAVALARANGHRLTERLVLAGSR